MQSPLSFGGPRRLLRYIGRLTDDGGRGCQTRWTGCLATPNQYQPALGASWLFQKCRACVPAHARCGISSGWGTNFRGSLGRFVATASPGRRQVPPAGEDSHRPHQTPVRAANSRAGGSRAHPRLVRTLREPRRVHAAVRRDGAGADCERGAPRRRDGADPRVTQGGTHGGIARRGVAVGFRRAGCATKIHVPSKDGRVEVGERERLPLRDEMLAERETRRVQVRRVVSSHVSTGRRFEADAPRRARIRRSIIRTRSCPT